MDLSVHFDEDFLSDVLSVLPIRREPMRDGVYPRLMPADKLIKCIFTSSLQRKSKLLVIACAERLSRLPYRQV